MNQTEDRTELKTETNGFRMAGWRILSDHSFPLLTVLLLLSLSIIILQVYRLQSNLLEQLTLQHARLLTQAISEFRTVYTSEVVERVRHRGVIVTHDYQDLDGAIPLPATLSIILGNRIGADGIGAQVKLYSPYPFPSRGDSGGLRDDFAKDAWARLNDDPEEPFFRFGGNGEGHVLRFAVADRMRPECIDCHNSHSDSPRRDWQVGDVRGVLEITTPLSGATSQVRSGIIGTAAMMIAMTITGLFLLSLVLRHLQKVAGEAQALAGQQQEANKDLAREVAERKRVEVEVTHHRDHLEELVQARTADLESAQQDLLRNERLAAIGQLTATVSHELRSPLGTIATSFAALKRRADLSDEKAIRTTERIERNLKRCETIIVDLLNYTRINALDREPIDLDAWMSQFLGELELPANVSLHVKLMAKGDASIDTARMGQVMTNLVDNAIDAMDEGSAPDKILDIETQRRGNDYVILVRDVGPGIDSQKLEHVFEPLVSTKAFGVGLGLPLVRQVVELHGGRVEIRNRDPQGTEVEIVMPMEASRKIQ